ncbi:unnamed protein product, partial [Cuscuta epithymum]
MTVTTVTQTTQGDETGDDILSGHANITTMNTLLNTTEEGFYWVLGDIVSIENFREWCYLSCPTCNKKLKPEEERFRCSNCNETLAEGVY